MMGYVYVLSNPSMPGFYKVGRSKYGGTHRACDLYQTGVPQPYILEFEIYTDSMEEVELLAHERLADFRVSPSREFFQGTRRQVVLAVTWAFSHICDMELCDPDLIVDQGQIELLGFTAKRQPADVAAAIPLMKDETIAEIMLNYDRVVAGRTGKRRFHAEAACQES